MNFEDAEKIASRFLRGLGLSAQVGEKAGIQRQDAGTGGCEQTEGEGGEDGFHVGERLRRT